MLQWSTLLIGYAHRSSLKSSPFHDQPLWMFGLLHGALQQDDCTSSSFLVTLWPWVKSTFFFYVVSKTKTAVISLEPQILFKSSLRIFSLNCFILIPNFIVFNLKMWQNEASRFCFVLILWPPAQFNFKVTESGIKCCLQTWQVWKKLIEKFVHRAEHKNYCHISRTAAACLLARQTYILCYSYYRGQITWKIVLGVAKQVTSMCFTITSGNCWFT